MAASRLGGRPFDAEREELTGPPVLPDGEVPPDPWLDSETPGGLWSLALTVVGVLLCVLVCLAVGGLVQALDTPWRWLGLVPAAGAAVAGGALIAATPPRRPWPLSLLGSAVVGAVLVYAGHQLLAVTDGIGGTIVLRAVIMPLFVLLALAVGYGVYWALVPSWFSRHANWLVPALLFGVLSAGYAWGDAVDAVRAGRTPPGYYGLRGTLMCVEPKDPDIPVYNGPLVTDRPVVTFGASGERVWLWAPSRQGSGSDQGRAMSVRLEDVTLTRPAAAEDRACRDGRCPGPRSPFDPPEGGRAYHPL
ncbi:hypothetical protein ABZ513_13805 [Streptomyces bacillaris]|uniref:hypothetical protein n=1 Tax=Streptomyces bacillaris TaxID=68179 RepID=UPI00345FFBC4